MALFPNCLLGVEMKALVVKVLDLGGHGCGDTVEIGVMVMIVMVMTMVVMVV